MRKQENKFDNQLSEALKNREIQPSENAWERVNLQRNREKSKSFSLGLFYKAAIVLVFLAAGSWLFFNQNESESTEIVTDATPTETIFIPKVNEAIVETKVFDKNSVVVNVQKNTKTAESNPIVQREKINVITAENVNTLAQIENRNEVIKSEELDKITNILLEKTKDKQTITESDLDQMIAEVRNRINQSNNSSPTDATALLKNSENELSEEYRNSVFQNFMEHKKIKIAFGR